MNKRHENLITYLANNHGYVSIQVIANHFSVSEKTIRRDLVILEDLITKIGGKLDFKRGSGVRLIADIEEVNLLQVSLRKSHEYNQDRKEREYLLALFLLLSRVPTLSFKSVCRVFFISKSQLLLDLKSLAVLFSPFDIDLELAKGKIQTTGKPTRIRDLLVFLIAQYLDYGYAREKIKYPVSTNKGTLKVEQLISENDIEFIDRILNLLNSNASRKIWKQDYEIIFSSLLVLVKYKTIDRQTHDGMDIKSCKKGSFPAITNKICEEIEKSYKTLLNFEDVQSLNNTFFATGLVNDPVFSTTVKNIDNRQKLMHEFSEDFIDAFSTITDIDLRSNVTFCKRIQEHIEPMINRVLINLAVTDRFLETYSEEYQSTMNVCEVICWILSRKYSLPDIPRAEVLFLMLYIQTEIIEAEERLTIGLVSFEDKSIVNLQIAQLTKEFPKIQIRQYHKIDRKTFFKDELDFVIFTEGKQVMTPDIPAIEISHRVSDLDVRRLRAAIDTYFKDSCREQITLQNTFRDLIDLGCKIKITSEPYTELEQNRKVFQLDGVGSAVFVYFDGGTAENTVSIQCPVSDKEKFIFCFDLKSWDLQLFVSKIVYLVDRTKYSDLCDLIKKITTQIEENNV